MKKIPYLFFPFLKLLWPASITLVTAKSDVILHCLHPSMPVFREDALLLGIHKSVLETCHPWDLKTSIFYFYLLCVWKRRKIQMPCIFKDVFSMQSVNTSLGTHSSPTQTSSIGTEGSRCGFSVCSTQSLQQLLFFSGNKKLLGISK